MFFRKLMLAAVQIACLTAALFAVPQMGQAGPNPQVVLITVPSVTVTKKGTSVTLSATVKNTSGRGIGSLPLHFYVDATNLGVRYSNSAGTATATFFVSNTMAAGPHTIKVTYAGNGLYGPNSGVGTLTVQTGGGGTSPPSGPNPQVTVIGVDPVSGRRGRTVTLVATLTEAGGRPIGSQPLQFKVDSINLGVRYTASNGKATATFTIPNTLTPGRHSITATFAGSGLYRPSAGYETLTVQ
jgi:large repetitive protein